MPGPVLLAALLLVSEPGSELRAAAENVERILATPCDAGAFDELVDLSPTIRASAGRVGLSETETEAFLEGVGEALLGAPFCRELEWGADIELLRAEVENERLLGTYRVRNDGVNYLVMTFERVGEDVRITDIYNYLLFEHVSERLEDTMKQALAVRRRTVFQRLFRKGDLWVEYATQLGQVGRHLQDGEYAAAHRVLDAIPREILETKPFLMLRFRLATEEGDPEARLALLDSLAALARDMPEAHLLLVDLHIENEDYVAALESVRRVDEHVGGDPYLGVLRAGIFLLDDNRDDARGAAEEALAAGEALALWPLLRLSILDGDRDAAVALLERMRVELEITPFDVELEFLFAEEPYSSFLKSRPFKKWRRRARREARR